MQRERQRDRELATEHVEEYDKGRGRNEGGGNPKTTKIRRKTEKEMRTNEKKSRDQRRRERYTERNKE